MSDEQESGVLSADEWARWAVLGDPYARVPATLRDIVGRVAQAAGGFHRQRRELEGKSQPQRYGPIPPA